MNLTDDVRVFARAAISNPQYPTVPAAVVRGVVLADCCSWREVEVRSIDSTPPRSRIETAVVHRGMRREFIGFNRARHAVLEAAIYATRLHLLPRAFIDSELARLQVIVDKTAGAHGARGDGAAHRLRPRPRPVESRRIDVDAPAHDRCRSVTRPARRRSSSKRRRVCTSACSIFAARSGAGLAASARRRRRRRSSCRRARPTRWRSAGEDADRAAEFRPPVPGPSRPASGGGAGCACIARCRRMPGSGRARSSRSPSRGRWPSCTAVADGRAGAGARGRTRAAIRHRHVDVRRRRSRASKVDGVRRATASRRCSPACRFRRLAVRRRRARLRAGHQRHRRGGGVRALPSPSERDVERVAHLVLMALLPALADADLATFGGALTEIQEITGRWFAPVQGGTFAPGPSEELVRRMTEWGASGVGQSSWGPAVYGIVDGEDAGLRLAERVRDALGAAGTVYEGPFRTEGARVWRARAQAEMSQRSRILRACCKMRPDQPPPKATAVRRSFSEGGRPARHLLLPRALSV